MTGAHTRAGGEQMGGIPGQELAIWQQREMLKGLAVHGHYHCKTERVSGVVELARTPAPSDRNTPGQAAMLPDRMARARLPCCRIGIPGPGCHAAGQGIPRQAVMPPDRNTLRDCHAAG